LPFKNPASSALTRGWASGVAWSDSGIIGQLNKNQVVVAAAVKHNSYQQS